MIFFLFFLSGIVIQISALGLMKHLPLQCSQQGLSYMVEVSRPSCSVNDWVMPRFSAPRSHPAVDIKVITKEDERNEAVPVLSITLTLPSDATIYSLKGMKVQVHELTTNTSLCVCYIFKSNFSWIQRPDFKPWSFVLDRIVVDPGMTYQVSVFNLPKPDGGKAYVKHETVPGCEHHKLQSLRVCLENGSLWDPNLTWSVRSNKGDEVMIELKFNTARFSDMYEVYVHSSDFQTELSHTVSKDNRTSISRNFSWELKHCQVFFGIKPFFIRCMDKCSHHQQKLNICIYHTFPSTKRQRLVWTVFGQAGLFLCVLMAVLLHNMKASHKVPPSSSHATIDKGNLETVPVQECSKVLIIYSQDHPMYTEIVLKLCAFLRAKCGTEVTLDLLDSTYLSVIGSIQWLDMQRKRLTSTSDKILILCSPGVCAKWNAMCGGRRVKTREDVHSPMGDMLTPALSLIIPEFVHAPSLGKYVVAYFDDVCSERDVPALFHMTVKYQLMKHFEELFFRLLNKEKYEPGRIKHAGGLGGDDYHSCPAGRALRDALKAFQAYQHTHPVWFETELMDVHEEAGEKSETENNCHCILQNEIQISKILAPVLTNIVKGQMTQAKPLLLSETTLSLSSQINHS